MLTPADLFVCHSRKGHATVCQLQGAEFVTQHPLVNRMNNLFGQNGIVLRLRHSERNILKDSHAVELSAINRNKLLIHTITWKSFTTTVLYERK